MLAGISHDLRTPLARLRLEAEISVADEEARKAMALDIDQLDAIIDKFMDYARPDDTKTKPVDLGMVIEREAAAFRDKSQIRFSLRMPPGIKVHVEGFQAKDRSFRASGRDITLPDGKSLFMGQGGAAAPSAE